MTKNVELEHTPTPWFTGMRREDDNTIPIIETEIDKGYMPICLVCPAPSYKDNQDKNASFIVRAVNAHDDLVSALKEARGMIVASLEHDDPLWFTQMIARFLDPIDSALEKAGE